MTYREDYESAWTNDDEQTDPIDQANALVSNLYALRARWRGNPVMTARLDQMVAQAERRVNRRVRAANAAEDLRYRGRRLVERDDEDLPF